MEILLHLHEIMEIGNTYDKGRGVMRLAVINSTDITKCKS